MGTEKNQSDTVYAPSYHVYGGKAALTFRANETRGGVQTINIEGAVATAPRQFDWGNKLVVQLTAQELPVVAAVFLGLMEGCTFKNHGEENNKGFALENQDKGLFCQLFAPGRQVSVPIGPADLFYVTALCLEQLRVQHPCLKTAADVSAVVARTVGRFRGTAPAAGVRGAGNAQMQQAAAR